MAEFLVIRLGENIDDPAHWLAVDATGARLNSPEVGPLSTAAAEVGERKVVVLVPGVDVLTTAADMPMKSKSRIFAALPFALEEFLADDVENLHFAMGPRLGSGRVPVSVVHRDKLRAWLDALNDAGINATSMIADNHGLARIPGTISMMLAENQVFINDGDEMDLVLQGLGPRDGLIAIGALQSEQSDIEDDSDTETIPQHVLAYCEPGEDEKYSHEWAGIQLEFDSLDVKVLPDGILPRLAVTVGTGVGINLLQGEFGAKSEYMGQLKPWKYAAILLLAFSGTLLVTKFLDYYKLGVLEDELRGQFLVEYQQIVPGATDIRDPAGAISSLRSRTGGPVASEMLLESLEQLSRALQQNQEASIEAITYRGGVVDIRLSAPNVSVLDEIQKFIGENGVFEAKILSTIQQGDSVNSRIQIEENGA
jgi:general secretion pathway protein L